ncbi:WD40-repeat-containing domain protein [Lipomyces japonicus]|uniref:WD40-repeat-containing domain protein n=1 Tax=Lipomyces japonicus TaxID=56871 RepID=UPI0034CDA310
MGLLDSLISNFKINLIAASLFGSGNDIQVRPTSRIPGAFDYSDDDEQDDDAQERSTRTSAVDIPSNKQFSPIIGSLGSNPNNSVTDPLSIQILQRANADRPGLPRRTTGSSILDSAVPKQIRRGSQVSSFSQPFQHIYNQSAAAGNLSSSLRNVSESSTAKKKHVSFISRLTSRTKHSDDEFDSDQDDDQGNHKDSTPVKRQEGNNAAIFFQEDDVTVSANHPKYIQVHAHRKFSKDFDRVFLAQELYKRAGSSYEGHANESLVSSANTSTTSLSLPLHKRGAVWSIKFSKDGKYLATGGEDRIVRVWSVISTADERRAFKKAEEDLDGIEISVSDFQSSHRHRASGIWNGSSSSRKKRLNAPVFHPVPFREFVGHKLDVLDLSWSKNNFLLSSSMDKTVRLWHVSRQECLCCFQHADFVTSIAFHPLDDRFFLSGSLDSRLRLWSIPDKEVVFWKEVPDLITAVAFSSDGSTSMAGTFTGLCMFFETEGLKYQTKMQVRSTHGKNSKGAKITGIELLKAAPNGMSRESKLLITSNDSRIRLYNITDKSLEVKLKGNENSYSQIRASSSEDGSYIIVGSEDCKVYIWNTNSFHSESKDKHSYEYFTAYSTIVTEAVFAPLATAELLARSGDPIFNAGQFIPGQTGNGKHSETSLRDRSVNYNIIVTADQTGRIKVFRQDCAYEKRKRAAEDAVLIEKTASPRGSIKEGLSGNAKDLEIGSDRRRRSMSKKRNISIRMARSKSNDSTRTFPLSRSKTFDDRTLEVSHDDGQRGQENAWMKRPSVGTPTRAYYSDNTAIHSSSRHRSSITPPPSAIEPLVADHQSANTIKLSTDVENGGSENDTLDQLMCKRCGGRDFKALITTQRTTRLVCSNCKAVREEPARQR